jgi:hypothetical protein
MPHGRNLGGCLTGGRFLVPFPARTNAVHAFDVPGLPGGGLAGAGAWADAGRSGQGGSPRAILPVCLFGSVYSSVLQSADSFLNCGMPPRSLTHRCCLAASVGLPGCGSGSSSATELHGRHFRQQKAGAMAGPMWSRVVWTVAVRPASGRAPAALALPAVDRTGCGWNVPPVQLGCNSLAAHIYTSVRHAPGAGPLPLHRETTTLTRSGSSSTVARRSRWQRPRENTPTT